MGALIKSENHDRIDRTDDPSNFLIIRASSLMWLNVKKGINILLPLGKSPQGNRYHRAAILGRTTHLADTKRKQDRVRQAL